MPINKKDPQLTHRASLAARRGPEGVHGVGRVADALGVVRATHRRAVLRRAGSRARPDAQVHPRAVPGHGYHRGKKGNRRAAGTDLGRRGDCSCPQGQAAAVRGLGAALPRETQGPLQALHAGDARHLHEKTGSCPRSGACESTTCVIRLPPRT